jgi:hypothetical protein
MYTVGSESDSPNDDPKTVTGSPPAGLLVCGSTRASVGGTYDTSPNPTNSLAAPPGALADTVTSSSAPTPGGVVHDTADAETHSTASHAEPLAPGASPTHPRSASPRGTPLNSRE